MTTEHVVPDQEGKQSQGTIEGLIAAGASYSMMRSIFHMEKDEYRQLLTEIQPSNHELKWDLKALADPILEIHRTTGLPVKKLWGNIVGVIWRSTHQASASR